MISIYKVIKGYGILLIMQSAISWMNAPKEISAISSYQWFNILATLIIGLALYGIKNDEKPRKTR